MMQVIGDMPPLPKPTITHFRVVLGDSLDVYANGVPMETQSNSHLFANYGNDLRHNRKEKR